MAKDSLAGYARFCSVFAVFGVVFLLIIGQMLQKQPMYIKGPEDKEAAAQACYQGSALYLVVWIASLAYARFDNARTAREAAATESSNFDRPYGSISQSDHY
jgi:hypothetical protein